MFLEGRMPLWVLLGACLLSPVDEQQPPPVPDETPAEPPVEVLPDPQVERLAASHILIAHSAAAGAAATVQRDAAAAETLARNLHQRIQDGADFAALAKEHSDGPSAPRAGRLGVFAVGTMVPSFERCAASVEVGALAPVCETPFGWHVIRREAVIEARASHIVVHHAESHRGAHSRTPDEARARAVEAARALQNGESFAAVAQRYSDDATAAFGGALGLIAPGQMVPEFEDALFALQPGEVSQPIDTAYGVHLIRRDAP